jgi:hypothetical protein
MECGGPGQDEAQYDFAIRGDYEAPVRSVLTPAAPLNIPIKQT